MTVNCSRIVLFDGDCSFCNHSVQFIIDRDKKGYFKFASIQSEVGQKLLQPFELPANIDSLILLEEDRAFTKSTAALRICCRLDGFWPIFRVFFIVPRPVRDFVYGYVAKNRYKWLGKETKCILPSKEMRKRFLQ